MQSNGQKQPNNTPGPADRHTKSAATYTLADPLSQQSWGQPPVPHPNTQQSPQYAFPHFPYLGPAPGPQPLFPQIPPKPYHHVKVPVMGYLPSAPTPPMLQRQQQPAVNVTPHQGSGDLPIHKGVSFSGATTMPIDSLLVSLVSQISAESATGEAARLPPMDGLTCAYQKRELLHPESSTSPMPNQKKLASSRKRSSTACDKCRQKKIKCDNARPRCGSCTRNDISDCRYSTENTHSEMWLLEIAYNGISTKLDAIMNELKSRRESERVLRPLKRNKLVKPQSINWDASLNTLFKWPYFQKQLGFLSSDAMRHIDRIHSACEIPNVSLTGPGSIEEQLHISQKVETDFHKNFSTHLNAFLINSHTKVPFLDIVKLIGLLEIFSMIKKADELVTLLRILKEFHSLENIRGVGNCFSDTLAKSQIEDSEVLRSAYRKFCESVPVILMVCAIGVVSHPVSLDNIGTYENSLKERASVGAHKNLAPAESAAGANDRFALSQWYIAYAALISATFPRSLRPYTIAAVKYHVLLSQYHHYTLNPALAHEEIMIASTYMVYFIEKTKLNAGFSISDHVDKGLVNRLFWTCLKLECELRVEMSPLVPLSPITQIEAPSSFFEIPEAANEKEHTITSINIANKYDDQNTWYYFLTEIALRKLENNMLDELYSVCQDDFTLDSPKFTNCTVWKLIIKYSNHLNGIVDSLTPAIKKFVLMETDPAQIYASIKRKANKKNSASSEEDQIPQILDDFLVDEDLLHHAQSEAVMFIKTRILSFKILLMRPLAHMVLHDKILFENFIQSAAEVLKEIEMEKSVPENNEFVKVTCNSDRSVFAGLGSKRSIYLLAVALNYLDYDDDEAYELGEKRDDFSRYQNTRPAFENFDDLTKFSESGNDLKKSFNADLEVVRNRVLKWFVAGIIAIPKLNMPKLGLFRHPGSWYYIRNLVFSVILLFLLYQKTLEYQGNSVNGTRGTGESTLDPLNFEDLKSIFKKEIIQTQLEHAILITEYWKDERKDCAIYGEYLRQCLSSL